MFLKKTVVMVSASGGSEKAVLSANYKNGETCGKVKLYNIKQNDGIYVLSFVNDGKVTKCGLTGCGEGEFEFSTEQEIDLANSVCAVVNIKDAKPTPLVVGNCKNEAPNASELAFAKSIGQMNEKKNLSSKDVQEILDENEIDFDESEKREIERAIDEEMDKCDCEQKNCAGCRYREAFYADEKQEEEPIEVKSTYYSEVSDQLKHLFDTCEKESALEEIIPNSKWVKVDYSSDGNYYVVGLIYEDETLKFVCFGVPGYYASESPKELEGLCKWVPVDSSKPFEFGYWITYQDAKTGENVEVEIV